MRDRGKRRSETAEQEGDEPNEPAFGLLLAVIVAGMLWVALVALVFLFWR